MVIDDRTHNIVVCCDGTWCGQETGTRSNIQILADAFASKGLASNVSTKDAKPVEYNPDTKTDVRYFNGVGLSGWEDLQKQRKDLPPLVSGLVGGVVDTLLYIKNCVLAGDLPDRCKEAYSFIAEKYNGEENSRVWLFGLSRGAYTVRAVAGMINNCGILHWDKSADVKDKEVQKARAAAVDEVYEFYRRDKDKPNSPSSEAFRGEHSWPRGHLPPVVFMGLLDTVGAEGIPSIKPNAAPEDVINYDYFHDVKVSSEVQRVFHAVATHDRLGPFEPCPVRRDDKLAAAAAGRVGGYAGNYPEVEFTTQEVWYPGAHYDIGRQDFVLGNNPYFSRLNRELNPLSSNVLCSQELADYPLLGRALKAHQPPPAAASSSSSSCGPGVSSSLCIVDLANSIQPGILPEASEDAVWQKLVEGRFADDDSLLLRGVDLGLGLLRRMGVFWALRGGTATLPLPAELKLCQPPYSIDAESLRLELVLDELARALNTSPNVLLRDRTIPLPPKDEFGAVEEAVFFRVPYDAGGDSSYRAGGRGPGWFKSSAYHTYRYGSYQNRLREALLKTPAGFGTWLAASASGLVQLSSKWLFEEVSNEHRPLYFGALAKSGYLQVAEGADYLLLVNPHGLQLLQQLLQEAELKAMQGSSSGNTEASGSHGCDGGAAQAPGGPGRQSGMMQALRSSFGLIFPSSGGAAQQGQGQGVRSAGQGSADPKTSSAGASTLPPMPLDSCIKLGLPTNSWWDRGYDSSRISDITAQSKSNPNNTVLGVDFKREEPECTMSVNVKMEACMKQEGRDVILGFKLSRIVANVNQEAGGASSSSSSAAGSSTQAQGSSSSMWPWRQKGVVQGFMDRVRISIQVQRQQTSELLQTINTNMDDVVEKKEIVNDYIYRYKEHQFKCSLELGRQPKATLGWDVAFKETPATYKGVEVALVTVNAKPQGSPLAEFGISSAPCTVEIKRQPRYTLLCNDLQGLGTIDSNPPNELTKELCFQVLVPPDCLSSSGLLDGKLEVRMAVRAIGGLLRTNAGGVMHNAQEVEVKGRFATSMVDGRVIQLGPVVPWETPWPGCKLHPRAPA